MNAPVPVVHAIGSLEDFAECAEIQRWFCDNGWASLHTAVDNLQRLADCWLLIDEYGQDAVQTLMGVAFGPRETEQVVDLPSDYAAQVVRQWELADLRDRWRHTAELPPAAVETSPAPKPGHRTPQTVVDAFCCVVHGGDANRLARWLTDHPRDASHLRTIWEAKCSIAAA